MSEKYAKDLLRYVALLEFFREKMGNEDMSNMFESTVELEMMKILCLSIQQIVEVALTSDYETRLDMSRLNFNYFFQVEIFFSLLRFCYF